MATGRGEAIAPLKQLKPRELAEQRKNDRLRCLKIMSQLAAMVENQMSAVRTAQINQVKEGNLLDEKADTRALGSLTRRTMAGTALESVSSIVKKARSRSRVTEGGSQPS